MMSVVEAVTSLGVLRVETEYQEVRSDLPELDPAWTYTDRAGHRHKPKVRRDPYRHRGWLVAGYPTLEWKALLYWCEGCGGDHDYGGYICPRCGEDITPGSRPPSMVPLHIPTAVHYSLDGEPITPDQYQELLRRLPRGGEP